MKRIKNIDCKPFSVDKPGRMNTRFSNFSLRHRLTNDEE